MGKQERLENRILRKENKQDEALEKGNHARYLRLQKRQEKLVKKHPELEDFFQRIDEHGDILEQLGDLETNINPDTHTEVFNLKIALLKERIQDIRKQLRRLERKKDTTGRKTKLDHAEKRLKFLEKNYLNINKKYNKKLQRNNFIEDMRTSTQINQMLNNIQNEINVATGVGGSALTDIYRGNKDDEQSSGTAKRKRNKQSSTNGKDNGDTQDTLRGKFRQNIYDTDYLATPEGKRNAMKYEKIANRGVGAASVVMIGVGLFKGIFGGDKDKRTNGRKLFAGGLGLGALQQGYNYLNREKIRGENDSEKTNNSEQTPEQQETIDNTETIMNTLGSIPFATLITHLNFDANGNITSANRDDMIQEVQDGNITNKYQMIDNLIKLRDNNGNATLQQLSEKRNISKSYMEANPEQNLNQAYQEVPPEDRNLVETQEETSEKEETSEAETTLQQHIDDATKEQDRRGYYSKLDTLKIEDEQKIEAMKTLIGLRQKYPSAKINILPINNEEIFLTTKRGVTQKINLANKTLDGFEDKSTGNITFPSIQQTLLAGRKSIVLVNLVKKIKEEGGDVPENPFKKGGFGESGDIDIKDTENARSEFRKQRKSTRSRNEMIAGLTAGSTVGLGSALLGSISWVWAGAVGVTGAVARRSRKMRDAAKDMLNDIDEDSGNITDSPTLNNHADAYIEYLNYLYDDSDQYDNNLEEAQKKYNKEQEAQLDNAMKSLENELQNGDEDSLKAMLYTLNDSSDSINRLQDTLKDKISGYTIKEDEIILHPTDDSESTITIDLNTIFKEDIEGDKENIVRLRKDAGIQNDQIDNLRNAFENNHDDIIKNTLIDALEKRGITKKE